jgi:hypothetical protein
MPPLTGEHSHAGDWEPMTDRARSLIVCVGWTLGLLSVVLGAGLGARCALLRFAVSSPWREHAIVWSVSLLAVAAGFLLFSQASWAWVYWRRGWRVRWIAEHCYVYEEFDSGGQFRSFEIRYESLEKRYAPPCRITVPSASDWNEGTPAWAHGRRDAILERLRLWGGGEGWKAPVTFVSAGPNDERG